MVSVEEATHIIFSHLYRPHPEAVKLIQSTGRVLGESITADRYFPPFDRVAMDGIAIAFNTWRNGQKQFVIAGTQAAGAEQKQLNDSAQCMEVMTGAMLPEGTDTVIRYEDLKLEGNIATIMISEIEL